MVRLELHALAYNLATFQRCIELPEEMADRSLTSLQLKLIKIGARVLCHARAVTFQLAQVAVSGPMVRAILAAMHQTRRRPKDNLAARLILPALGASVTQGTTQGQKTLDLLCLTGEFAVKRQAIWGVWVVNQTSGFQDDGIDVSSGTGGSLCYIYTSGQERQEVRQFRGFS